MTGSPRYRTQGRLSSNPRALPRPTLAGHRCLFSGPRGDPRPQVGAAALLRDLDPHALLPRPECDLAPLLAQLVDPPAAPLPGLPSGPPPGQPAAPQDRRTLPTPRHRPRRGHPPLQRGFRETRRASSEAMASGLWPTRRCPTACLQRGPSCPPATRCRAQFCARGLSICLRRAQDRRPSRCRPGTGSATLRCSTCFCSCAAIPALGGSSCPLQRSRWLCGFSVVVATSPLPSLLRGLATRSGSAASWSSLSWTR